ncbi:MAG: hypothetical protein IKC52_00985 [Clostridia bacterium]|nr:hypothetical protein [Clostridia bacterium]
MTQNYTLNTNRKKVVAIVVAVVVALVVVGIVVAVVSANSTIRGGSFDKLSLTMGQSNKIVYTPPKPLEKGQNICWYINGNKVRCSNYVGGDISVLYTPNKLADVEVKIVAGKYEFSHKMKVLPNKVDLYAPNVTVTYGEEIGELHPFLKGNNANFSYNGQLVVPNGKLDVGTYDITFSTPCKDKNCIVRMHKGKLTVVPKVVSVGKVGVVFNNSTTFEVDNAQLDGVLEGDQVFVENCTLHTSNKNVGVYQSEIVATLGGKDAKNYTLQPQVEVEIAPRLLLLKDWAVQDKPFDGTTKASLKHVGRLEGVIADTDVFVGEIVAEFDNANVGTQKANVCKIVLCGKDKDNYKVHCQGNHEAKITKSWLSNGK